MKKLLSLILTLTLILPCISAFALNVSAESKYQKLINQRYEYIDSIYDGYTEYLEKADGDEKIEPVINYGNERMTYFPACELTILLYTNIAKDLTLEINRMGRNARIFETSLFDAKVFDYDDDFFVQSSEINKAIEDCKDEANWIYMESRSALRACIKYFDISKEELIKANKLMQEDPDIIRELLPSISDEEFERARWENGLFCAAPLEDFMIEALYLKDDVVANNLLCMPYAVYVKEYNSVVCLHSKYYVDKFFYNDVEYDKFDLTSVFMGDFINLCYHADNTWIKLHKKEGQILKLKETRESQLANPKPPSTGEAVYLIPVALVSLTLGALVIYPRRRKIDNI